LSQSTNNVLVLDAGDALGPEALSWFDEGTTMALALQRANVAAMLPGNIDLVLGLDVLLKRQKEALLPMVLSNMSGKEGVTLPVSQNALVQVGDVLVGVLGVLDPAVVETVPPRNIEGFKFFDPVKTANETAKALRAQGAMCVIALTHMDEGKTLSFARQLVGIDLVVAGGYGGLEQVQGVPYEIRLLNGLSVVTTPRYGVHLGRVDMTFRPNDDNGTLQLLNVVAQQIPIDASMKQDAEIAERVADLKANYDLAAQEPLGRIWAKTIGEQGQLVAGIMRGHIHSEVGMINRGSLRKIVSDVPLKRGDVDELIRFDDRLVKMLLTGKQLKAIVARSQRSNRDASQLMVVGFNPKDGTVNRRPIRDDEVYRVAVTEFLAEGGDGYVEFKSGTQVVHTGIALRGLMATMLQDTSTVIGVEDFSDLESQSIWRASWGIDGAFNRNYIDRTTLAYRKQNEKISFLSGETSVSWNAIMQWALTRDMGQHIVRFENRMSFGQVGTTFGDLEKSEDQFDADLTYVYRTRNFVAEPYGSVGYSTAITATDGQRPKLVKSSTGFLRRVKRELLVSLGARAQRDLTLNENDVGFEIGLDVRRKFHQNGQVRSRVRSFFGVTDRRVISVENYNTLTVPLMGGLSLSARQSNFLYRVNKIRNIPIDGIAFRWDLTLGLGYDLDWKWY
jgi:2',3'-cyclic-nucleotide 2'-phosphodiesterase (5'-nucleotidase family)